MSDDDLKRLARQAFLQSDAGHLDARTLAAHLDNQLDAKEQRSVSEHLEQCEACRAQWRDYRDFTTGDPAADAPPADWEDLRRRLFRPSQQRWWDQKWLVAAALLVAASVGWTTWAWSRGSPEQLLAEAYAERRPFEFRINAAAPHGTVRSERGSRFQLPAPLLKLQAQLAAQLKSNSSDPTLLRLKGEAELMAGEAVAAQASLVRANELAPGDAATLGSLGAAYALRADEEQRPELYTDALEYLSQSLKLQPAAADVLFNCALVLERMHLYDRAVEQWAAYLRLDANGKWAEEASHHLAALKGKLTARQDALNTAEQADPALFAAHASGEDAHPEAYLPAAALSDWVPRSARGDAHAAAALSTLGVALVARHGDAWLQDFVQTPAEHHAEEAARAHVANRAGRATEGLALARAALAKGNGTSPTALWLRYEEVVGLHNLFRSQECAVAAGRLVTDASAHNYWWFTARAGIEQAICDMRLGQFGEAALLLKRAIALSERTHLDDTLLRANLMYLDCLEFEGLRPEIYTHAHRALAAFWQGGHPPMQYQQIVDRLRVLAAMADRPRAALHFARASLWAAEATSNPLVEIPAHIQLGVAAQAVGEWEEARRELAFEGTHMPPAYFVDNQISLAKVEASEGSASGALTRLESLVAQTHGSVRLELKLYAALGDVARQLGLRDRSIEAYRKSLERVRIECGSLSDARERAGLVIEARDVARGLVEQILAQAGPAAAASEWMAFRALDAPAASGGSAPPTVLSCIEFPSGYTCLLIGASHSEAHRIPATKRELESAARRFRALCADPGSDPRAVAADARRFYSWIIEPFGVSLGEPSNLTIELDGGLSGLPLPALLDPQNRYLGERFALAVWSGFGQQSRGNTTGPTRAMLVIANPAVRGASATRYPALPESSRETEALRASFADIASLEGANATVDAVLTAIPRFDMVHFAGHGFSGLNEGALVLAPALNADADYALLRPARLRGQDWSRCRLVVLSACATAGESGGADRPDNLVRSIQQAGVARVAASSWSVDSAATAEFMTAFYGALSSGGATSPEEALEAARRRVRSSAQWSHPYYWAAFQLYRVSQSKEIHG